MALLEILEKGGHDACRKQKRKPGKVQETKKRQSDTGAKENRLQKKGEVTEAAAG